MDQENRKESGKNVKVHFDLPQNGANETASVASNHRHTASSSTASSSIDLGTVDDDDAENIDSLSGHKQRNHVSQGPMASPEVSIQTSGCSMQSGSSTTSSLFQNAKLPGYDPYRIPASIFSSKPSTPMEWSVASNESLFSIHVGNDSFIMMQKSGELNNMFQISGELTRADEMADVPIMPSSDNKSESFVQRHRAGESHEPAEITDKLVETSETKNINLEENRTSTSFSYRSDGSCTSAYSFQFPL